MNRSAVSSFVVVLLLSLAGFLQASNRRATPKDKLIPLPRDLQKTFDRFRSLIKEPSTKVKMETIQKNLSECLLPSAFHIEQSGYRKRPWKDEINLPFFFHHKNWDRIYHITKLSEECFHISTENTNLYFVLTASNEWRLYKIYCFSEWKQ